MLTQSGYSLNRPARFNSARIPTDPGRDGRRAEPEPLSTSWRMAGVMISRLFRPPSQPPVRQPLHGCRLPDPIHAGSRKIQRGSREFAAHPRATIFGLYASEIPCELPQQFRRKSVYCDAPAGRPRKFPHFPWVAVSQDHLPAVMTGQGLAAREGKGARIRGLTRIGDDRETIPFFARKLCPSLPSCTWHELFQRTGLT